MLMVMKHAKRQDIIPHIFKINSVFEQIGKENFLYLEVVFSYILNQADTSEAHKVVYIFKQPVKEENRDKIMTIAERLIREGVQQGVSLAKITDFTELTIDQVKTITSQSSDMFH